MIATIVCALVLVVLCPYSEAISPLGTWDVIANGYSGYLVIGSVDSSGDLVDATFFGNPVEGFWSALENKITFIRLINTASINTWQTYVGYGFLNDGETLTFAGYFDFFSGTGGTSLFNRAGWSATLDDDGLFFETTPETPTYFDSTTWSLTSNGYTGTFVALFDSDGTLTGTFRGTPISDGFWNLQSQSVDFVIVTTNGVYTSQQVYHGWLSQYEQAGATWQVIDGYFVALAGTGATASVTEYGWQAILELPGPTSPPIIVT
jgi:hypothetical protein